MLRTPTRPVIVNNSPLVALWELGHLALLRELYAKVLIPKQVEEEFVKKEQNARQTALGDAPWIEVVQLATPLTDADYVGLDRGEAAVLALAKERGTQLVIFDDLDARKYAQEIGLPVTGTVGVLVDAKKKGLLDVIEPLLMQMQTNGVYLGDAVIEYALRQAGETD